MVFNMGPYAVLADNSIYLVTLTFDLLTLVSGHSLRDTWLTSPLSFKILRLPFLLSSDVSRRIPLIMRLQPCPCAVSRDPCVGGKFFPHIFEITDPDLHKVS